MRLFSDTQDAAEADEDAVDSDCGESMLMKMSAGRMWCRWRCWERPGGADAAAASAGGVGHFSTAEQGNDGGGVRRCGVIIAFRSNESVKKTLD